MNAKRTCGECEHYPSGRALDDCLVMLPMWIDVEPYRLVRRDDDAARCGTFKPKIKGEE